MKKPLLFVLALAVIPVGVDAQNPSADYWRPRAEAGEAIAQYNLGVLYATGQGVPQDNAEAVQLGGG
jgi:TPR repeat protein